MWLSLLLSVGAEASGASDRKAGLRELAQRLGVAQRRLRPGLYGRVEAWLASHPEAPEAARAVLLDAQVSSVLNGVLEHLGGPPKGTSVYFPGNEIHSDGMPILHYWNDAGEVTENLPAVISTRLDSTVGWWLEQMFQIHRAAGEFPLWQKMNRVGLLNEGAAEHVQDWIEMTHPDLGRYTWATAKDASDAWHTAMTGAIGYRQPIAGGDVRLLATWADGARLVQLMSKRDFAAEGTAMGHCVGGNHVAGEPAPGNGLYWQGHRDGRFAVLSYRDSGGVPQATLNFIRESGKVVLEQAHGPDDALLTPIETIRILRWMVPYLRSLSMPEASIEESVARMFGSEPQNLFLEDVPRLLREEDPLGLGRLLAELGRLNLDTASKADIARLLTDHFNDPKSIGISDRVLSLPDLPYSFGWSQVDTDTIAKNMLETGVSPLFMFGPVYDAGGDWPFFAVEATIQTDEKGGLTIEWSAFEVGSEGILEPTPKLRFSAINPFPMLWEKGILLDVDRLVAWLTRSFGETLGEVPPVTTVAAPTFGVGVRGRTTGQG